MCILVQATSIDGCLPTEPNRLVARRQASDEVDREQVGDENKLYLENKINILACFTS